MATPDERLLVVHVFVRLSPPRAGRQGFVVVGSRLSAVVTALLAAHARTQPPAAAAGRFRR